MAGNRNDVASNDRDTTTKVKFNEVEGEVKEITVFIDPYRRLRYGRRTSVAEALLGVSVCPFPDSTRIMIAGYMPNSEISQNKAIKIGDWLKSVNNQDINVENFELIMLSFTQPTYIRLHLQRIAVEEPPQHQPNIAKVTNTTEYVDTLRSFFPTNRPNERDKLPIFSLLLLSTKDTGEHSADGEDVIFSYPPKQSNYLYRIRGTFLTMNSLFRECTFNSKPKISCITIQSIEYYVSYYSSNDALLLVAMPAKRTSLQDAKFKLNTLVRCLEFSASTLAQAFYTNNTTNSESDEDSQNNDELRNFAIDNVCAITKLLFSLSHPWNTRLESILPDPIFILLPTEGQLRIEDALTEMEAMDYREWNDEPLKSHREFYILGSALYYRKYLLCSHLPTSDLLDIESFLRTNGIYLLIEHKPVRELIIWREIYPKSISQMNFENEMNARPHRRSRWFLTVIARNQLFMAVILESRHRFDMNEPSSSSNAYGFIGPSRFYIEEIQDTLDHLQSCGIENLTNTWLNANKRPEVLLFKDDTNGASTGNSSNATHSAMNTGGTAPSATGDPTATNIKNTEVISILKRRNNSAENVTDNLRLTLPPNAAAGGNTPSIHSQTYSDSSLQKYEDDDDDDDDDSDSDWEGFQDSQRSNSAFDMSDMASTLFREISDVPPDRITAGRDNVLYYYVEIETGEGMILAPPSTHSINVVLFAFQKASLLIHSILQNSMKFRDLLSQEATTHSMSRSLVAIKEHGVLITDELTGNPQFWVIGRLLTEPKRELYICHRADVPQNMVEIAYRLSLMS